MEDVGADLAGEGFEALALGGGEITGAGVENADGAEELVVGGGYRDAGEETEMRCAVDEGAGGECGVGAEVGDFEGATLGDSESVEGEIEIEFVGIAEIVGEAPALLVAGTDEGDGGLAEGAGELGDVVEVIFETVGLEELELVGNAGAGKLQLEGFLGRQWGLLRRAFHS